MIKKPWQEWELELLKEAWPRGAMKASREALPHRTPNSLRGKANHLGLKMEGRAAYRKQPSSEWIDAALRRAYRSPDLRLAKLAKELDRTKGWLKWRAGLLGICRESYIHYRRWEPEEQRILEACIETGYTLSTIQRKLRAAGFTRSLTAIKARISDQQLVATRTGYTAIQVAQLFGLDSHSVTKWIEKGWLSARRTVGPLSEYYPDEVEERRLMYSVTPLNIKKFMLAYPRVWDHRRMRIEVLLDLLCGDEHGLNSGTFGAAGHHD